MAELPPAKRRRARARVAAAASPAASSHPRAAPSHTQAHAAARARSRRTESVNHEERHEEVKLIDRDHADIRTSLQEMHENLLALSDVTVVMRGPTSTREFPCSAALLASASRPLAAMLYGPMRAVTPQSGEKRPELHLHGTEPWCFDHLLRYIHGLSVPLDIETAVQLFSVADYYAVVQLRDSCCNFLLEALRPENCCTLLARSHDVHCEQLTYRCMHTLVLEFVPVVENDARFPSISAELLRSLIERDDLVCECESQVVDAVLLWYEKSPTAEKLAALPSLLAPIRWHLIPEGKARSDLIERAAGVRAPGESARPMKTRGGEASSSRGGAAESDVARLVRSKLDDASSAAPEHAHGTRQTGWGVLEQKHVQPADAATDAMHKLVCVTEYMIGRSRKSDIRIGHTNPMPYVSSQHFRIFHSIHWPDASEAGEEPRIVPVLEDLSQNGTFVNGKLIGKQSDVILQDGDRIELVFPQGRLPTATANSNNSFPNFTYHAPTTEGAAGPASATEEPTAQASAATAPAESDAPAVIALS